MSIRIAVPGASGHTGRFVVAELERRGLTPVACDRTTDLDQALGRADAVINCAGPFAATAEPVIAAAIRAGIPYLDVTAEIEVITDTFARHADAPVPRSGSSVASATFSPPQQSGTGRPPRRSSSDTR